jgi:hypothetical protein
LAAEQVWVAGVVHPGYETNGRPILHILQAFAAQPGQTLTTDSYTLSTEPQLVQSSNSLEPLVGGNMIIEYVELAYFFDPIGQSDLAEPVWVVSGHWRDKQELFVAYLDAVVR